MLIFISRTYITSYYLHVPFHSMSLSYKDKKYTFATSLLQFLALLSPPPAPPHSCSTQ